MTIISNVVAFYVVVDDEDAWRCNLVEVEILPGNLDDSSLNCFGGDVP